MNQSQRVLSTYAADLFGISSALYELGGLIVMHDASGCNSTYGTHDEPRWYDTPSMVYISGLNEVDTIHGNDKRLRDNIKEAALEMQPAFIAISGSPMPNVIGSDLKSAAALLERETGIPCMGFRTDGIHTYAAGAGEAFLEYARRFLKPVPEEQHGGIRVNILGVTPLDFSVTGNTTAMRKILAGAGIELISLWAMGSSPEELQRAPSADLNLVVSSAGLSAASYMEAEFGIPYLCMTPVGKSGQELWLRLIRERAAEGKRKEKGKLIPSGLYGSISCFGMSGRTKPEEDGKAQVLIIGEPLISEGIKNCLMTEFGIEKVRRICPLPDLPKEAYAGAEIVTQEQHLARAAASAERVIADPIYARLLPEEKRKAFIRFPHEAYSGRHYREEIPVFTGDSFSEWIGEQL